MSVPSLQQQQQQQQPQQQQHQQQHQHQQHQHQQHQQHQQQHQHQQQQAQQPAAVSSPQTTTTTTTTTAAAAAVNGIPASSCRAAYSTMKTVDSVRGCPQALYHPMGAWRRSPSQPARANCNYDCGQEPRTSRRSKEGREKLKALSQLAAVCSPETTSAADPEKLINGKRHPRLVLRPPKNSYDNGNNPVEAIGSKSGGGPRQSPQDPQPSGRSDPRDRGHHIIHTAEQARGGAMSSPRLGRLHQWGIALAPWSLRLIWLWNIAFGAFVAMVLSNSDSRGELAKVGGS
ncbi:hypothetical protein B0T17DRAFT_511863 [Bombardia bombarda]|uniref:Uncharacterized protein n=1 Tax=Bombardia bombarda TaxID=252184 RepID=A0AA39TWI2_9PEZI|nr:hypothetical protein B0T17DRAFT_511863 [Bombardia bombarda]